MRLLWLLPVVCVLSCGAPSPPQPSPAERREAAYRANNRGVALLEQLQYEQAAAAFREALQLDPTLRLAHINLPIALFYAGRTQDAARDAAAARARFSDAPQPPYLIGLIDRAENRLDAAAEAFRRVLAIDPDDIGAKVNLALVYMQQQRYREVVTLCDDALADEPYNATAAYNLGLALSRLGDPRAPAALARFEALRSAAYAITYSQTYLEQGRYAEALTSTGAEPDLVSQAPSAVTFVEAIAPAGASGEGAVALADLDGDGDLDVIDAGAGVRVLRNDRPALVDVTGDLGLAGIGGGLRGVVAADADNDTRADLLLVGTGGARLFVRQDHGGFRELDRRAFPAAAASVPSAAFADVDHDGDLDVVLGGAAVRLLRNNGNGTFTDVTRTAGLQGAGASTAIAPGDFDNRRDIDLLLVSPSAAPRLFRNLRTGAFADVAASVGLTEAAPYASVAAGDVNKDGFVDLFLGRRAAPGVWAVSDGRGGFRGEPAPAGSQDAAAAQLVDYDNDGLLDLITAGPQGARAFRNVGRTWSDETARVFADDLQRAVRMAGALALAAGDLDLDGDADLAAHLGASGLRIWRNDGGNRHHSLRVRLQGRVSNRHGVGAKVEVRAGSLFQRVETMAATPAVTPSDLLFGLATRQDADAVRVLWPAGIVQAETMLTGPARTAAGLAILELDRKPSSCPYLYTWNGREFEFVTDFMGGGEMGYWLAPGVRNVPDPTEYVRITDTQLQPRDGRFEIRVTNELEETLFVDHLELVAVTHPADTMVFPDEGLRAKERPFRAHLVRGARPPAAVRDEHGHDVLARVARMDRAYPDDFDRLPIRGYAREHALTIDVPPDLPTRGAVLLLTGWTDYAFSGDNLAAHQAGRALSPPVLQVQDGAATWRTIDSDVGIPVGRPQTLVVNLAPALAHGRRVRLVTNMRIYWDRILAATADAAPPAERLARVRADLRWRGFSAEDAPDGREPIGYDYERVLPTSPWKLMPGRYTREGRVEELLDRVDDRFVISRPGDELALSFDGTRLPPPDAGMRRTYLLHTVGYSKEMDLNSASPDQAAPIPFRAMSRYPYVWPERYPHVDDLDRFHTRVISRSIGSLVR